MREFLAGMLVATFMAAVWFPESAGRGAHKIWNEMKVGWESVP